MPKLSIPVTMRDHSQGPATAPVTLLQYADYECQSSGRAYPMIKQVQAHFGPKLRFVYRNFPLSDIHPHAVAAAQAAEAAAFQGKFWEMHDYLFEHQSALGDADLVAYAKIQGLDMERFHRDQRSHEAKARVRDDLDSGVRSGVNGTPTFFIDDTRYDGSWDSPTLIAALEARVRAGRSPDQIVKKEVTPP